MSHRPLAPLGRLAIILACCAGTVASTAHLPGMHGAPQASGAATGTPWFDTIQMDDHFWSEGATYGDINRDGRVDVISGPYWYAGPDYRSRNEFYPATQFFERVRPNGSTATIAGFEGALGTKLAYSDNFFAYTDDFNADGWLDILVIGFPGRDASWYENPRGRDQHWQRHVVADRVDNESPTYVDLFGDGRRRIVCNSAGRFGYWEPTAGDPRQPWTFRAISPDLELGNFTHGLGVGDVDGDGRLDLIEGNGWWQQPASIAGHPTWTHHPAAFGKGAQYYAYDVNGDGRNDVIGSLAAHGYGLAWWEQEPPSGGASRFTRHMIMGERADEHAHGVAFSQLHALALDDIDGDGLPDIVVGKRFWAHGRDGDPEPNAPAVVYWFKLVRQGTTVEWVPHLVHDDSGVGTQVVVGDVNLDKLPDIVVGNKKGTFLHLQRRPPRPTAAANGADDPRLTAPFRGLRPAEAAQAITLPEGFRAHAYAGEPDVRQPIAFAIDDRGRVWVAEAYAYPVRQPEGQGKDRILVFEDTDGDGRHDRRTIFADDLNLISAIEVGFGGVWVGAAPHLLFIPMQDGDEPRPAGPPQVMLDGWGYEDTHETLNSFIWGPDGWLYGAHGVFTNSTVGRPGADAGARTKINGGIWRFHPTTHRFEVFAEGLSNPWGLDFNDRGHAVAEACVIPHLWHVVQGGRYQRQAGQHFNPHVYDDLRTIADHLHYTGDSPWDGNTQSAAQGGGHAHAGLMVYLGGSWPEAYRGQAFMSNIHGARINVDALEPRGSGYVGRHARDFLEFNDPWSQVVNLQYDQDGSVFLIDWYDQEQCHLNDPEVPDRGNGRIFKVVYGDTPTTRPDVQALSDAQLTDALLLRNDWHVRHARRVLQERAAAGKLAATTVPTLRRLLGLDGGVPQRAAASDEHPLGSTEARLRLLWALHVTGGLDEAGQLALLGDADAEVRAWTVQIAAESGRVTPQVGAALTKLAQTDSSSRVALYLASAAQRLPAEQRWGIAEALHARESSNDDHNLPLMAWWALEPLAALDAPRALRVAAQASSAPRALEFTARRIAATGTREALATLVQAVAEASSERQAVAMLAGMNAALRGQRDLPLPDAWTRVEPGLFRHASAKVRTEAQTLALTFGSATALQMARETLEDAGMPRESRRQALRALVNARDSAVGPLLLRTLDDPRLRADAIRGLAAVAAPRAAESLVALYPTAAPADQRDVLLTLSSRPDYADVLAQALDAGTIPARDVSAEIARQMRLLRHPALTASLTRVWGVARTDGGDRSADVERYRAIVQRTGGSRNDASRGRAVFDRTCASCHALFGEGGTIGPDITGSNRANLDYLLHNILDPNAEIPNAYRAATLELRDGRVLSGVIGGQDDRVVTVVTTNETVTVPRADIRTLTQSEVSMMPEGLLEPLTDQEVRDLMAYLRGSRQVARAR